jgi:hypothetical protein
MRKFYFTALLMLVSSLGIFAQENEEAENMVIEMQDGSKLTVAINNVKEIAFLNGNISVPGNDLLSLSEKLAQMSSRIDSLANVTKLLAEKNTAPSVRINPVSEQWEISNDGGRTWASTGVVARGRDGRDGVDARIPNISIGQAYDGNYYWMLDGQWLLSSDGNRVRANGKDGQDGKDGDNLIREMEYFTNENGAFLILTIMSGQSFMIPLAK